MSGTCDKPLLREAAGTGRDRLRRAAIRYR
ncbi:hypothetical protein FHS22_005796 [Planomonospora venezuelensis]|uniref:Uncharacterized protein n=1 Tax=Planomonospora venezuelensis TaxID=1999 RepID=A0A841DDL1_PLAVE|nr:hypothetical protein [Planomonospora venezuelensis]